MRTTNTWEDSVFGTAESQGAGHETSTISGLIPNKTRNHLDRAGLHTIGNTSSNAFGKSRRHTVNVMNDKSVDEIGFKLLDLQPNRQKMDIKATHFYRDKIME